MKNDKLIILPSPMTFSQKAWDTLLEKVRCGSTLLLSGVFSYNEYYRYIKSRCRQLSLETKVEIARREEALYINGAENRVSFGGEEFDRIDKEIVIDSCRDDVHVLKLGNGTIIWSPLPVELNDNIEAVENLYRYAAEIAEVSKPAEIVSGSSSGILLKKLSFDKENIFILVSENGRDRLVDVRDNRNGAVYNLTVPACRAMLFSTDKEGNILNTYRNCEVKKQ